MGHFSFGPHNTFFDLILPNLFWLIVILKNIRGSFFLNPLGLILILWSANFLDWLLTKRFKYGYFERKTIEIPHKMKPIWLRKESLKKETESLYIAAQNNAIRINYAETRIDNTQENRKSKLRKERDETINHIESELDKKAQKDYITRQDLVAKKIPWELRKRLKSDPTTKQYIQKPEFVLENETHDILWDFAIQMNVIPTRRSDLRKTRQPTVVLVV